VGEKSSPPTVPLPLISTPRPCQDPGWSRGVEINDRADAPAGVHASPQRSGALSRRPDGGRRTAGPAGHPCPPRQETPGAPGFPPRLAPGRPGGGAGPAVRGGVEDAFARWPALAASVESGAGRSARPRRPVGPPPAAPRRFPRRDTPTRVRGGAGGNDAGAAPTTPRGHRRSPPRRTTGEVTGAGSPRCGLPEAAGRGPMSSRGPGGTRPVPPIRPSHRRAAVPPGGKGEETAARLRRGRMRYR